MVRIVSNFNNAENKFTLYNTNIEWLLYGTSAQKGY